MPRKVVILGGGITGLAAAHALLRPAGAFDITLLERATRLGGNIRTVRRDGFVLDGGPDSWVASKPHATALARALGLEPRFIPTKAENRRVYIAWDGLLHPLPEGMVLGVPTEVMPIVKTPLFSWDAKLRMALEPLIPPRAWTADEDESIGDFVARRLGDEVAERLAGPLLGGIFAGDAGHLSVRAAFPQFVEAEKKYGSLIRAMVAMRAARKSASASNGSGGGGERVPLARGGARGADRRARGEGLARRDGARAHDGRCASAPRDGAAGFVVMRSRAARCSRRTISSSRRRLPVTKRPRAGHRRFARATRSAASTPRRPRRRSSPTRRARSNDGSTRPASSSRARCAGRSSRPRGSPASGPTARPTGWCSCASSSAARAARTSSRTTTRSSRRSRATSSGALMGIDAGPIFTQVFRFVRASPQPGVGHLGRVRTAKERIARWPGLFVAGSGFEGSGIPDCVKFAEGAAEAILWRRTRLEAGRGGDRAFRRYERGRALGRGVVRAVLFEGVLRRREGRMLRVHGVGVGAATFAVGRRGSERAVGRVRS